MIVAFSGLGGSGKSTQIEEIITVFNKDNLKYKIIVLRGMFFWQQMAEKKRIISSKNANELYIINNKKISLFLEIKLFFRSLVYFIDSWRIYLFIILPKSNKNVVICDRFFHDFFIELNYPNTKITLYNSFFVRLLPNPDIHLFFATNAQTVFERKREFPLVIIKSQEKIYNKIFSYQKFIINIYPYDKINETANFLKNIILDYIKIKNFKVKFDLYILFKLLIDEDYSIIKNKIIRFDVNNYFENAKKNRILFLFINRMNELDLYANNTLTTINIALFQSKKIIENKNRTVKLLGEIKNNYNLEFRIIKENNQVELGTDIDIIFPNRENYNKFTKIAEKYGKIVYINKDKSDFIVKNGLSVDLHFGTNYFGFNYVENDFIWKNPSEGELLNIISHSLNELTMITLGDLKKVQLLAKNFSSDNWDIVQNHVFKMGWKKEFDYWLKIYKKPYLVNYNFPYFISIKLIFMMKLKKYLYHPSINIFFDLIGFIKAIRARNLGKIPYHDSWFQN
ncbi:MAG: hypothetical protein ACD_26C00167G0009 [uncultured bacterium]|nr:MAG: hypothetical protein ACD_26C00167G0009 [uncultured bacterium]